MFLRQADYTATTITEDLSNRTLPRAYTLSLLFRAILSQFMLTATQARHSAHIKTTQQAVLLRLTQAALFPVSAETTR